MKNIRTFAVFNLLSFLVHLVVSYLTQFKVISTQDVGEVAEKYASLFTPAGVTFSIWGLIYISLGIFCIYHISRAWAKGPLDPANKDTERIGGWFIANNLATAAWLVAWTQEEIFVSLACIIVQLISLIVINLRLHIYDPSRTLAAKVCTMFPMSIYFAWITIATIANMSVYFIAKGWDGGQLSSIDWTRIMIGVAVLIATLVVTTRRNVFYGLVVVWALYGIVLKRNEIDGEEYFQIIQAAWIGIAVMGLVCVLQLIKNNVSPRRFEPSFPVAHHSLK